MELILGMVSSISATITIHFFIRLRKATSRQRHFGEFWRENKAPVDIYLPSHAPGRLDFSRTVIYGDSVAANIVADELQRADIDCRLLHDIQKWDHDHNLVLMGGAKSNKVVADLYKEQDLPLNFYAFLSKELWTKAECRENHDFIYSITGPDMFKPPIYSPTLTDNGKIIAKDVGLITRIGSKYRSDRWVLILDGGHEMGTIAAAKFLTTQQWSTLLTKKRIPSSFQLVVETKCSKGLVEEPRLVSEIYQVDISVTD